MALVAALAGFVRPVPGFARSGGYPAPLVDLRLPFDSAPGSPSLLVAGSWLAKQADSGSFVPASEAAGFDSEVGIK